MSGAVQLKDKDGEVFDVDAFSRGLVLIDTVHARIHAGVMFHADHLNLSVGAGSDLEVLFQVPSAVFPHFRFLINCGSDVELQLFEGATFSAAGTSMTVSNRNRNGSDSASCTPTHTPTITGDGTRREHMFIPGGGGPGSTGAQFAGWREWILKPSTSYLFRATNRGALPDAVGYELDWYEPS